MSTELPLTNFLGSSESVAIHEPRIHTLQTLSTRFQFPSSTAQRGIGRHDWRVLVLPNQRYLNKEIDSSPHGVQETRKREVEEPRHKILRCGCSHKPLYRPIATLYFPSVAIFSKERALRIRHEHRILLVIIMLGILLAAVNKRRQVPLVVPEMQPALGFIPVLATLEESLWLCLFAGLHTLWHDVGKPSLIISRTCWLSNSRFISTLST